MNEWTEWHEKHKDKIEILVGVDCWIWKACVTTRTGHGRVSYNRKGEYAHRAAFMEFSGLKTIGLVRHKCGVPACVRPGHLAQGTSADNGKDMAEMFTGRGHLIASDVRDIRAMYEAGVPLLEISQKHKIAYGTVYPIVIGKSYRHVDPNEPRLRAKRSPAKISRNDIVKIRAMLSSGTQSQAAIAKMFGVRQSHISRIKTGVRHLA